MPDRARSVWKLFGLTSSRKGNDQLFPAAFFQNNCLGDKHVYWPTRFEFTCRVHDNHLLRHIVLNVDMRLRLSKV